MLIGTAWSDTPTSSPQASRPDDAPAARAQARRVRWTVVAALLAAGLPVLAFTRFGIGPGGVLAAFFCVVLVVLSVVDIESRRLPNAIVLPAFALVLVAHIAFDPGRTLEWVLAALGAALFLLLPLAVSPGGMGMGDVKLALLLGAALGRAVIPAVFIGLACAALYGLFLIVRHGLSARKRSLAFGPFLAAGAVAALFLFATP